MCIKNNEDDNIDPSTDEAVLCMALDYHLSFHNCAGVLFFITENTFAGVFHQSIFGCRHCKKEIFVMRKIEPEPPFYGQQERD